MPLPAEESAGGCRVAAGTAATHLVRTATDRGATIARCQQLGDSYLSPGFDVTVDASARATGPAPGASQF